MRAILCFPLAFIATACAAAGPSAESSSSPVVPVPVMLDGTGGRDSRSAIVATATDLVWLMPGDIEQTDGRVVRMPKAGGALVQIAGGQLWPQDLALDGENVYWTNFGLVPMGGGAPSGGGLVMSGPGGSATVVVPSGASHSLAVASGPGGSTAAYWIDQWGIDQVLAPSGGWMGALVSGGGDAVAIAVDETDVYWVDGAGRVGKASRSGGTVTPLAGACTGPWLGSDVASYDYPADTAIVLDASTAYWMDPCGNVSKVDKNGGSVTTLALQGPPPGAESMGRPLAADDTRLFWREGARIASVFKDGSPSGSIPFAGNAENDELDIGGSYLGGVAVDETFVYWTDGRGVWRSTKP